MAPTDPIDRAVDPHLLVVDGRGERQRFLRGILTHDLILRGLDFETAYATARAVRDRLGSREEVTTAEIHDLVQEILEQLYDGEPPPELTAATRREPGLRVVYNGKEQPFSRGLLARSIYAADITLDRAYRLVTELETELRHEGVDTITSSEVARRIADLLERFEGADAARHYRLVRRLRRLPRPLVLFIGGASGTGKSTLALELAPLLRIYRINSTDTIRQVMRMVFSPNILPAIHGSSFEPGGPDLLAGSHRVDPDRLIAHFSEQATRVAVGVRAVVERAVAENMSIVVEGIHLVPPLVPFPDLEGSVYQVALMLGTRDREAHRSRFLGRARLAGRRAERYLERFDAIRALHDYLLHQAETHDVTLLDTSTSDLPVTRTLALVATLLQKRLPSLQGAEGGEPSAAPAPTLLLVIDGLGDRPVRALGWRTPLQAAELPTLDRLAREGRCGLADPVAPGVVPDTAGGSLALFGQSPFAMKRGPVEALGAGVELSPSDIALRANFAAVDEQGRVIDRRAGRIRGDTAELAAAIDRLPLPGSLVDEVEVLVRPATEHRLAVVLRGEGLSSAIQGSDPGEGAPPGPSLVPRPLDPDDAKAVQTARILALFEQEARKVLEKHPINEERRRRGVPPANAVLTRGAGRLHQLASLEADGSPLRLTCIAGDRTILGIAAWLGATTIIRPGMTANLDTDLRLKFATAARALEGNDLVVLHVKGADIAAHDQRPDLKVAFLERVDRNLGRLLEAHHGPLRVAVAGDHATISESGQHSADPLPVVIWGTGIGPDGTEAYDEQSVQWGGLQRFPLQMLLSKLFALS